MMIKKKFFKKEKEVTISAAGHYFLALESALALLIHVKHDIYNGSGTWLLCR